jgi:hypothetical protein
MEGPEFKDLLRTMRGSTDVWSSIVFTPTITVNRQELDRYWDLLGRKGWPISEIAAELGVPVADVHQLRARALGRLGEELSGLPEGWQRLYGGN